MDTEKLPDKYSARNVTRGQNLIRFPGGKTATGSNLNPDLKHKFTLYKKKQLQSVPPIFQSTKSTKGDKNIHCFLRASKLKSGQKTKAFGNDYNGDQSREKRMETAGTGGKQSHVLVREGGVATPGGVLFSSYSLAT